MHHFRTLLLAAFLALGLSWIFWGPLFRGGGFVGGDLYSYYFPQKTLYAEGLKAGDIPFWNSRTGHGYPLVGESQTGVFYPFHLLAYRTLELNTAYNAIHLLHYVLAFVFTVLYARSFGASLWGALLAAIVYTFGWFPARSCVEWAIVGGAWLPAALWCVERFLQTKCWRYAIGLSAVLGVQMLAGHFEIAFITQLTLVAYVSLRIWWASDAGAPDATREKRNATLLLAFAMLFGFALAAVQLFPTAELKRHSQRSSGDAHELNFGSIPVWYLSQTFMPWKWYSPFLTPTYSPSDNRDTLLGQSPPALGGRTNQVESHLYFGLIPLGFAVWAAIAAFQRRDRKQLIWLTLGLAATVYATGVLLPLTRHLPGFSFFQGPGRFGVLSTLAVAMLAASGLDRLIALERFSKVGGTLLALLVLAALGSCWSLSSDAHFITQQLGLQSMLQCGVWRISETQVTTTVILMAVVAALGLTLWCGLIGKSTTARVMAIGMCAAAILATTACDLWIVGQLVSYTTIVDDPPITHVAESSLRQLLQNEPQPVRLLAPGANLPNVLGVASTPVYLTFGPAEYEVAALKMPEVTADGADSLEAFSPEKLDWLRRAGVTHVLSRKPLDLMAWPAELVWQGIDPVLNRAWSRTEPLWLYKLRFDPATESGRIRFAKGTAGHSASVSDYRSDQVTIDANSPIPARLILTDLAYPGWKVTVDGNEVDAIEAEGMYRAVDLPSGSHTIVWSYRPFSLGAVVSVVALLVLAAVAHVRFWHGGSPAFSSKPGS